MYTCAAICLCKVFDSTYFYNTRLVCHKWDLLGVGDVYGKGIEAIWPETKKVYWHYYMNTHQALITLPCTASVKPNVPLPAILVARIVYLPVLERFTLSNSMKSNPTVISGSIWSGCPLKNQVKLKGVGKASISRSIRILSPSEAITEVSLAAMVPLIR